MAKLANKFDIGCDPEFAVLDAQGKLVNLAAMGHDGFVGYDHNGRCAELRPDKARGSWTLVKRLRALLTGDNKLEPFRGQRWRAGAYVPGGEVKGVSLGGHVHFDFPTDALRPETVPALDALTRLMERTELLPQSECTNRRTHTLYGKWSDMRSDAPDGHVEYRTMASWLFNPWVTFLALTAAKLVVCEPAAALAALGPAKDRGALFKFIDGFRGKDVNADRFMDYLPRRAKYLDVQPDADIKEAWEKPCI